MAAPDEDATVWPIGLDTISHFRGEHGFLSNFYFCPINYKGNSFTNSEAVFQSEKTLDTHSKGLFCRCAPEEAKKLGKRIALRPDWEEVKVGVMRDVLDAKFTQNPSLKQMLLATRERMLVEGNTWNDRYWGAMATPRGVMVGRNMLGRLLMDLRSRLRALPS